MKKLILEEFNKIPNREVFAKGEIENSSEGIFMTDAEGMLKWVAKKGDVNDWAIYVYWNNVPYSYVEKYGDKLIDKSDILKIVPCTDEVLRLYRH